MVRSVKLSVLVFMSLFGTAQAVPWGAIIKNGAIYGGANLGALAPMAVWKIYSYLYPRDLKNWIVLNENNKCRQVIDELLHTYADGRSIKIYGPDIDEPVGPNTKVFISDEIQAKATDRDIFVYAAVERALKDEQDAIRPLAKAVIGHEIGHIVHNHVLKWKVAIPTIAAVTSYGLYKVLHLSIVAQNRFVVPITLAGVVLKNGFDALAMRFYKRCGERQADFHVIEHTKDPAVLHAMAACNKMNFEKFEKENPPSLFGALLDTHPSSQERAAYFAKAAEDLEKKQK